MMYGDGGRAGTARARCGNDRYDGKIHYGSSELSSGGARDAGGGPTGGGGADDRSPLGSTCQWARRCADAKTTENTLDDVCGGAAIIEDISGDQNKTGTTTAPGTSGAPRENVAPDESQKGGQTAGAPYPVSCDVAKKFFASYFTTGSKSRGTVSSPCAWCGKTALTVIIVAAGLLIWLCREPRQPLSRPRAEPCEWPAWTGLVRGRAAPYDRGMTRNHGRLGRPEMRRWWRRRPGGRPGAAHAPLHTVRRRPSAPKGRRRYVQREGEGAPTQMNFAGVRTAADGRVRGAGKRGSTTRRKQQERRRVKRRIDWHARRLIIAIAASCVAVGSGGLIPPAPLQVPAPTATPPSTSSTTPTPRPRPSPPTPCTRCAPPSRLACATSASSRAA